MQARKAREDMSELTICYKVVRHRGDDSELRWSLYTPMQYEVAYKPGRETMPMKKKTKLYVFESQKAASHFAKQIKKRFSEDEHLEVWLVLAGDALPCTRVCPASFPGKDNTCYDYFWSPGGADRIGWSPPKGTLECEAVTLIECLERSKGTREDDRYVIQTSAP